MKKNEIEFIEIKNRIVEMRNSINGLDIRRENRLEETAEQVAERRGKDNVAGATQRVSEQRLEYVLLGSQEEIIKLY